MAHYVDKAVQTHIEGLTRDPDARPAALCPPTDTTTPPAETVVQKLQLHTGDPPTISKTDPSPDADDTNMSPSQVFSRKNRPRLVARISLPAFEFDAETPLSPPPTHAVLSPLPAANKLHAGHTPIIPRALSPIQHYKSSGPSTPDQEEGLSGPLTLPPQPGDGAEDTIPLNVLNAELEKLRIEQEMEERQKGPTAVVSDLSPELNRLSTKSSENEGSQRSRKSSDDVVVVDGVILKKPKMNLGAPLGQA